MWPFYTLTSSLQEEGEKFIHLPWIRKLGLEDSHDLPSRLWKQQQLLQRVASGELPANWAASFRHASFRSGLGSCDLCTQTPVHRPILDGQPSVLYGRHMVFLFTTPRKVTQQKDDVFQGEAGSRTEWISWYLFR